MSEVIEKTMTLESRNHGGWPIRLQSAERWRPTGVEEGLMWN